ncbi:uncharacterized protein LOC124190821 isoform X3 [Daphnia pulex]|uniref:uncharacterized protein LOC124190821 isoform X3 n=1 Tax=Daphnia pulex TaxID=6669 RepID=UPI001EDDC7E0|nr:uncharacterized protein LOC124190821 isoform X3 [Daphnia pulex]
MSHTLKSTHVCLNFMFLLDFSQQVFQVEFCCFSVTQVLFFSISGVLKMDDSWALPFNPDEIFILEHDIEILTDPILGLLLLGQENADEVDVETFLDLERFLFGDNPADNTHGDVFQDFVFEVNPQNGQTVTAGGLEEDGFDQEQRARSGMYEETGRSVSQTETKHHTPSPIPTSSAAECLPAAIKSVVPAAETPRGRPKKAAKSALDLKIDKLLNLHKSIRQGRRRKLSLPGDGRRNGMMLSAIQRLLSLKTDQGKIPREASELVAAGVAEKDVGAVERARSLSK